MSRRQRCRSAAYRARRRARRFRKWISGIPVTGEPLESAGLHNLEWRGPGGQREPLAGLAVRNGQTLLEALEEAVAKRGEVWSIWAVVPGEQVGA